MSHFQACGRIYHIKSDSLESLNTKERVKTFTQNEKLVLADKIQTKTNTNMLTGLLSHYDSDSESENATDKETLKLDEKVDDFLQEIEQLSTNSTIIVPQRNKCTDSKFAWQECFDEMTGYPYYWNLETNIVTWEMPQEYKEWLQQKSINKNKINPEIETEEVKPIEPPSRNNVTFTETIDKPPQQQQQQKEPVKEEVKLKKWIKKKKLPKSDSDDEKIEMITSYSEHSSSEDETEKIVKIPNSKIEKPEETNNVFLGPHFEDMPKEMKQNITEEIIIKKVENTKDENIDQTIALSRLKTKAKVQQEIGDLQISENPVDLNVHLPPALSLVAGYGDDSENEETEEKIKLDESITILEEKESILFPITKPIDIKQFEVPEISSCEPENLENDIVDTKLFKRKRRLGIELDVLTKNKQSKVSEVHSESFDSDGKKGFGFNNLEVDDRVGVKKPISFVKADVLNPIKTEEETTNFPEEKFEDYESVKRIVSEKVNFLCEGKTEVSHVQVMLIQLQTLEAAYKCGGLKQRYLYNWLKETFTELGKLETEAAPIGWCCVWDRWNKRYYYRNQETGDTQWQFPEPQQPLDIVGGGEAMDICTTPPPPPADEVTKPAPPPPPPPHSPEPPSPPNISVRSPSPPSPPVIRPKYKDDDSSNSVPPSPPRISQIDEPLPPGVDLPDLQYLVVKPTEKSDLKRPSFGTELDSFYSDIAQLEASNVSTAAVVEPIKTEQPSVLPVTIATSSIKKKKKVKIGKGLTMKKKAVSTLVEKWKKVQNDYI